MSEELGPIDRRVFEAGRLMATHPPIWRHRNKEVVYGIACPPGAVHRGEVLYSRWAPMALPETIDDKGATARVDGREGAYDYAPAAGGGVEWHVNFADPDLFVWYGSALFAQDEIQVAEHPALGALREALQAGGHQALTVEDGRPTPILIMGVERRCRVATDRNIEEGRPVELYGNDFGRAEVDAVRRATTRIEPPTITHLIAMAAPSGGRGRYNETTIRHVLVTAFTGFRAAVLESARAHGHRLPVVVHTGFWGCGAFGGHRVLMAMLQVLAAQMAGVERLVFHAVGAAGLGPLEAARSLIEEHLARTSPGDTGTVIERITGMGFEWGVSDGN
jgi:hypothetical protein